MTPNKLSDTLLTASAISAAALGQSSSRDSSDEDYVMSVPTDYDPQPSLGFLRPQPLRPDQVNWPKNQRKNRKNKRRLFAAGGRVNFKK